MISSPEGVVGTIESNAPWESLDYKVDLTIFVPCYNEENRLKGTLETIQEGMSRLKLSFEVIVVDDGSKDRTLEVAHAFREANPSFPLRIVKNRRNLGLARSFVETSFRGTGRYYRLVCGDNVEPVKTMVELCGRIGEADMILPYYPVLPGKSRYRKMVSRLFGWIVNFISGNSVHYYNGCGIFRRYDVMRWAPHDYGFGFQADLITRLIDENATYIQVAVDGFHYTKESARSPLNLRNFLSVGFTLFKIFVRRAHNVVYGK